MRGKGDKGKGRRPGRREAAGLHPHVGQPAGRAAVTPPVPGAMPGSGAAGGARVAHAARTPRSARHRSPAPAPLAPPRSPCRRRLPSGSARPRRPRRRNPEFVEPPAFPETPSVPPGPVETLKPRIAAPPPLKRLRPRKHHENLEDEEVADEFAAQPYPRPELRTDTPPGGRSVKRKLSRARLIIPSSWPSRSSG